MPKRKLQMRFRIEHELKGRMRLHVCTKKMSYEEADTLQYYLGSFPFVTKVKVHENIGNVTVNYVGSRKPAVPRYLLPISRKQWMFRTSFFTIPDES